MHQIHFIFSEGQTVDSVLHPLAYLKRTLDCVGCYRGGSLGPIHHLPRQKTQKAPKGGTSSVKVAPFARLSIKILTFPLHVDSSFASLKIRESTYMRCTCIRCIYDLFSMQNAKHLQSRIWFELQFESWIGISFRENIPSADYTVMILCWPELFLYFLSIWIMIIVWMLRNTKKQSCFYYVAIGLCWVFIISFPDEKKMTFTWISIWKIYINQFLWKM